MIAVNSRGQNCAPFSPALSDDYAFRRSQHLAIYPYILLQKIERLLSGAPE